MKLEEFTPIHVGIFSLLAILCAIGLLCLLTGSIKPLLSFLFLFAVAILIAGILGVIVAVIAFLINLDRVRI